MAQVTPLLPLCLAAVLAAAPGCETFVAHDCDDSLADNPPVTYAGGQVTDGVYLSSPWGGDMLRFSGGMVYRLEHGLGEMPRWITLYDSFSSDGTGGGGGVARASPNEAVIVDVSPQAIEVQNPGCQDFWLRVAAGAGAMQP